MKRITSSALIQGWVARDGPVPRGSVTGAALAYRTGRVELLAAGVFVAAVWWVLV